jgi:predicted ribosomally synthesized peptide with nif11-like leader
VVSQLSATPKAALHSKVNVLERLHFKSTLSGSLKIELQPINPYGEYIMLSIIKELLQNAQLQQQIKTAANQAEVIKLLILAGAEKGYNFTVEGVSQAFAELTSLQSNELSEEELLGVSGGKPVICYTKGCTTF